RGPVPGWRRGDRPQHGLRLAARHPRRARGQRPRRGLARPARLGPLCDAERPPPDRHPAESPSSLTRNPDTRREPVSRVRGPRLILGGMGLAIVAVTAAQLLDLATFTRMVSVHGPRVEANPLVVFLLTDMGLPF